MKGQAAIEYLTTYGWALLALVIVIAVLVSTGIFSPNYLVSEECSFGNNLMCDAALFNQGGATVMRLRVFNGFPYKIRLTGVSLQGGDGTQLSSFASEVELESGAAYIYEAEVLGPQLQEDSVKRFSGSMSYVSCAPELGPDCSTVEHSLAGRVTSRVIPE